MKPAELDADKLFIACEECRADITAHFRKIMELQKENQELEAKLRVAVEALEGYANPNFDYILRASAEEALKKIRCEDTK